MSSKTYWLTIAVPARDDAEAQATAARLAKDAGGRIVQVEQEPPQGSTVVGDMHEDALEPWSPDRPTETADLPPVDEHAGEWPIEEERNDG